MKNLITISLVLLPFVIFSQDKIILNSGFVKNVTILDETDKKIVYKNSTSDDTFEINKNQIKSATYSNGRVYKNELILNRHSIGINMTSILFEQLEFQYRFFNNKNRFFIQIPISASLAEHNAWNPGQESGKRVIESGIGINFMPGGKKMFTYYVGTQYIGSYNEYYKNDEGYLSNSFMLNNGLLISPTDHFSISLQLALGFESYKISSNNYYLYNDDYSSIYYPGELGDRDLKVRGNFDITLNYSFGKSN